jgi:glyoxylase-like metal-dependent hydrolase (beta-lactamase superfamily II)
MHGLSVQASCKRSLITQPLATALGLLFLSALSWPQPGQAQSFDIISVADGVYAAIGRPGVASNGAFIVNKDDVLVVDTHLRPSWARDLIAEVRKVTSKPVRYVVDTHWHPDHVQGNQAYLSVFGNTVEYLAQHNTREDMIRKGIPSVQQSLTTDVPNTIARLEKFLAEGKDSQGNALTAETRKQLEGQLASTKSYLEELKQIQITLPTLTFERSLILHKPDREIHIYYFGKGHTRGDVVVYLPKEKVLVCGDLLTNGIPFTRDAYPVEWITTLEALDKLDWTQAIPGHGGVQQGKGQLEKLIAYMKEMVAAVKDAVAKGMSLEEAKKTIDLGKHAANFPNFAGANTAAIERAWAEVTGKITD